MPTQRDVATQLGLLDQTLQHKMQVADVMHDCKTQLMGVMDFTQWLQSHPCPWVYYQQKPGLTDIRAHPTTWTGHWNTEEGRTDVRKRIERDRRRSADERKLDRMVAEWMEVHPADTVRK